MPKWNQDELITLAEAKKDGDGPRVEDYNGIRRATLSETPAQGLTEELNNDRCISSLTRGLAKNGVEAFLIISTDCGRSIPKTN